MLVTELFTMLSDISDLYGVRYLTMTCMFFSLNKLLDILGPLPRPLPLNRAPGQHTLWPPSHRPRMSPFIADYLHLYIYIMGDMASVNVKLYSWLYDFITYLVHIKLCFMHVFVLQCHIISMSFKVHACFIFCAFEVCNYSLTDFFNCDLKNRIYMGYWEVLPMISSLHLNAHPLRLQMRLTVCMPV